MYNSTTRPRFPIKVHIPPQRPTHSPSHVIQIAHFSFPKIERDWHFGTASGKFVSMAVSSTGCYGIPEGTMYSFPVSIADGKWTIVEGIIGVVVVAIFNEVVVVANVNKLSKQSTFMSFQHGCIDTLSRKLLLVR